MVLWTIHCCEIFRKSLLQLERNSETKVFGCRAQFRLENCNWKQLDGMVVSSDHVGFPSKVPHVKKMDNFFGLGTIEGSYQEGECANGKSFSCLLHKESCAELFYGLENVE
jgi:hypothetical protein